MSSGEVNKKHIHYTDDKISNDGYKNSSATWLKTKSVLVALAGQGKTRGTVAVNELPLTTNQSIAGIEPIEDYSYLFIFSNLEGKYRDLREASSGDGTRGGLNKKILEAFKLNFPSPTEQTKIGALFSHIDSLIASTQKEHEKLVALKKCMLQKMFPHPRHSELDSEPLAPEIRFKGFTGDWEEKKLGEVCEFSKGSGYSKSDIREDGIPLILYGRLYTKYETVISEVDTFAEPKENSVYSTGCEVIVPASGETAEDIAVAAYIEKKGFLLGGDLNILKPKKVINPIFLALSITYGAIHTEIAKKAQGKSVVHIHNSDFSPITFHFPSLPEQQKIGSYFQNLDNLISKQAAQLEKLKNVKKTLLGKMFV